MKSLRRFETVIIGGRADRPLRSDVRLGSYKNGGVKYQNSRVRRLWRAHA